MLWVLGIVVAAGAAMLGYASLVERNWFALRRHRIPCLPPGSAPFTILHLSDLHLRAAQRRKRRWIAAARALRPDLAVGTGDFLGDDASSAEAADAVTAIAPRVAGLFVLGSNDYFGPTLKSPHVYFKKRREVSEYKHGSTNTTLPALVAGLEAAGWLGINNRHVSIQIGEREIDVLGLDDPHIGRADMSLAAARTDERFRLAVVHSPDVAEQLAALGYDLILSGHTHGGQVRVPFVGALVSNSTLPPSMARGAHRIGARAWLHVSAGLGTSMFAPVRFACRPEMCLLELVPRED